mmetsp:Transcript_147679/g.456781  ORF Transcript_147679/g.456781 Transcript_147679/m.456781 type:complete len:112 (+) Transcript_147679:3-338(+)
MFGAQNTPLVEPAKKHLAAVLQDTLPRMSPPRCRVYMNSGRKPVLPGTEPAVIAENLLATITESVHWDKNMLAMLADGMTEFHDVGPGSFIKSQMRSISPKLNHLVRGVDG